METSNQTEQLLHAWVTLSGILKNSRITKGLMYNEAVIMLIVYKKYCEDGKGVVSIKEIINQTKMLKSLVTRTLKALEEKGLIERCDGLGDKRINFVCCVKEKLDVFLGVHRQSLELAQGIINIIGEEDAEAFIRIVGKIESAGYSL